MSALIRIWQQAAADLGFVVKCPATVDIAGITFKVPVLVEGFGAKHGMVIVSSYSDVKAHAEALADAGFGYCVMSEPRLNEPYDLESFIELLSDWGWTGSPQHSPGWLVPSAR